MNSHGPRQYTFGEDIGKLYLKRNVSNGYDEDEDPEVTETRERAARIQLKNSTMNRDNLYDDYWGKNN